MCSKSLVLYEKIFFLGWNKKFDFFFLFCVFEIVYSRSHMTEKCDLLFFLRDMGKRAWEQSRDSDFILSVRMIICQGYKVIKLNSGKVCFGIDSCKIICG